MLRNQQDDMVYIYYPIIKHSFFCFNRNANDYMCSCNYGIRYKTKYVHCSEIKSPYDLWIGEDCYGSDWTNLHKYHRWVKRKKLNVK